MFGFNISLYLMASQLDSLHQAIFLSVISKNEQSMRYRHESCAIFSASIEGCKTRLSPVAVQIQSRASSLKNMVACGIRLSMNHHRTRHRCNHMALQSRKSTLLRRLRKHQIYIQTPSASVVRSHDGYEFAISFQLFFL